MLERFTLTQLRILDGVVLADGNLVRAFKAPSFKLRLEDLGKIRAEVQGLATKSTTAMQHLKDTFSGLKGKTKLKVYPTASESQETAPEKLTR